VLSGGQDSGTTVIGNQVVYGSATGATISGTQYDYGTASSTTVASGGQQYVIGTALSGTVLTGGTETVLSGGHDSGTTVSNGGILTISSGGSATADTVAQGGTVFVQSGGMLNNVTISGGGSGASNSGTIVEVNNGGSVSNVTFAGPGTLVVDATTFSGSVIGFGSAGAIDLSNIASAGATETYDSATHILTVTNGLSSATFTFDATIGTFSYSADSHGGLVITDPPATGGGTDSTMLMAQYAAGFQSEVGSGAGALVTTPTSAAIQTQPTTLTKPT
jgi:autotransporter passenger strand-loop-strand repeat protein